MASPLPLLLRGLYGSRQLPILIYHHVIADFDPMRPDEVTAKDFDQHLRWISDCFTPLTLAEAINAIDQNCLPKRPMVITFDDGYANNCDVALPILEQHKLKATFFVTTDFIEGGMMWNDMIIESMREQTAAELDLGWLGLGRQPIATLPQKQQLAYRLLPLIKHLPAHQRLNHIQRLFGDQLPDRSMMMSERQLQTLHRAGMEIGGHTCSHPILTTLDAGTLQHEIAANKEVIEAAINTEITSFAYPNGKPGQDYNTDCVEVIKQVGYRQAVSTAPGVSTVNDDRYQLRRYTPWRRGHQGFLAQLARNRFTRYELLSDH